MNKRCMTHDLFLIGLVHRERGHQLSAPHGGNAVAHAEQLGEVGGNHEDCASLSQDILHDPIDLRASAQIDALGWLVEDEDRGAGKKPSTDERFLLIAARETMDWFLFGAGANPELSDQIPALPELQPEPQSRAFGNLAKSRD